MKKLINIVVCVCFIVVTFGCGSLIREGGSDRAIYATKSFNHDNKMGCYNMQQEVDKLHRDRIHNKCKYEDAIFGNCFFWLVVLIPLYDLNPSRYLEANETINRRIEYLSMMGEGNDCVLNIPEWKEPVKHNSGEDN